MPPADRRKIARLYGEGLSLRAIARVVNWSKDLIHAVLVADGVPMRRPGRQPLAAERAASDLCRELRRKVTG